MYKTDMERKQIEYKIDFIEQCEHEFRDAQDFHAFITLLA